MLLTLTLAHASFVTNIGDPVTIPLGGNFARAHVHDDGTYSLFWAAGGDYNRVPLSPDFDVDDQQRSNLTGRSDLVDHAIRECNDGTFLHATSLNVVDFNDTSRIFTYDADLTLTNEVLLDDQNPELRHNDMMLWCGERRLVGYSGQSAEHWTFDLNADGTEISRQVYTTFTQFMGGQFWRADGGDGRLYAIGITYSKTPQITVFDTDLNLIEDIEIPDLAPDGKYPYWPQGFLRIGDHFVILHMARSDDEGFSQDTGNVYLTFMRFDDLAVVEQVQLTEYAAPNGAMRPWAVRDGDDLILTWDKELAPHILRVSLDTAALGEDAGDDSGTPKDTGAEDSGSDDSDDVDSGDTPSDQATCGCATAPGAVFGALPLALLRRRRVPSGSIL